jgi:hypothetical protein
MCIVYNKTGKKYQYSRKKHLAEKGDTARHGNIQEAGTLKGGLIDENHRPAS